jgi:HEAT repeat protein
MVAGKHTENTAVVAMLGWLRDDRASAALFDLLDRPELRRASIHALAMRGSDIVPAVLERFPHSSEETQLGLIELCGRLADRNCVPLLLECLGSGDSEVIVRSLDALARMGDDRAYASTKTLLRHASLRIRQAAVAAINSLGQPQTAADMKLLLQDADPLACESAIMVVAYFGFADCVDLLMACCDHSDERVRRTAIEHLPLLEDRRVSPRLKVALESDCKALRVAAAGALGQMDRSLSVPLLRAALDDEDAWVRYFAVRSLARTDYSDSTIAERLVRLAETDPAMQVRIAAVDALKSEAIPTLIKLVDSPEDDLAVAALKALGATGHSDAVSILKRVATTFHSHRQIEAIRALGSVKLDEAIDLLRQIALQRDKLLAEEAINTLGHVATEKSLDVILEVMGVPAKRTASSVALRTLGEFAIPLLARRLHALSLDVRRAVIDVLIAIGTHTAIEILETALTDPEPAVRHGALSALTYLRASNRHLTETSGREGA